MVQKMAHTLGQGLEYSRTAFRDPTGSGGQVPPLRDGIAYAYQIGIFHGPALSQAPIAL